MENPFLPHEGEIGVHLKICWEPGFLPILWQKDCENLQKKNYRKNYGKFETKYKKIMEKIEKNVGKTVIKIVENLQPFYYYFYT